MKIPGLPDRVSIFQQIESLKAHSTGFDYLRIVLATLVIFIHSKTFTLGPDTQAFKDLTSTANEVGSMALPNPPLYQPIIWAIVPAFFALSGFLVAGSLRRSKTVSGFLTLRALRIFPALAVESMLAMLILGPLVTNLPLNQYFSDPLFIKYALNIVGDIHYYLPGVFTDNPTPRVVNAQLWTIPAELDCYVLLAALAFLRITSYKFATTICALIGMIGFSLAALAGYYTPAYWAAGGNNVDLKTLVLCFMAGVAVYDLREYIFLKFEYFVLSVILSYVFLFGGLLQFLAPLPLAYAVAYVGYTNFPKTVLNRTGDYSYGVYLYGLPVQQLIVHLFPQNKNWILSFVMAYAVSLVLAAFSWHFVESKVMSVKGAAVAKVERLMGRLSFSR